jgi:hypothetical protein
MACCRIVSPLLVAGLLCCSASRGLAANNLNRVNTGNNTNNNISRHEAPPPRDIPAPPSLWNIELTHRWSTMQPDAKSLRARIEATLNFPQFADPIILRVIKKDPFSILEQLGLDSYIKGAISKPEQWVMGNERLVENLRRRLTAEKLTIGPEDLVWLDLTKLGKVLQTRTATPEVSLDAWDAATDEEEGRFALQNHLGSNFARIETQIQHYRETNRDSDAVPLVELLPPNLKTLYARYSYLRGRNCFGTALEFANPRNVLDKTINIETEKAHFRTMINSDEFMRGLWLGYYELSPQEILMGLRWGDVVAFYDGTPPFSWLTLRHAAVHLAGDIYFHKQSKSASSPIELTDWQSLINTWAGLTPNLDYKVFRRLPEGKSFLSPTRAMEKLSWTR